MSFNAFVLVILSIFAMCGMTSIEFAHAESYAKNGFYMEYPDGWHVSDEQWKYMPSAEFASEDREQGFITVSLHDGYPVSDTYTKKTVPLAEMNVNVLDFIASDASDRCRANMDGPCWSFDLTDSRIVTISNKRGALIDYDARINDRDTLVRLIVLPSDSGTVWVVRGTVPDTASAPSVMEALDTFALSVPDTKGSEHAPVYDVEDYRHLAPADPHIVLEKVLNVNIIMIGEKWSPLDMARILENLPSYHDPVFSETGAKVGVRYHYTYNFVHNQDNVEELVHVMDRNSVHVPVFGRDVADFALWQEAWLLDHPDLYDMPYRLVDAAEIEEYVQENIIDVDPGLAGQSSVNLVFLNIPPDETDHIQNYYFSGTDRATGKVIDYKGLMGFGATLDNAFFFDLWAVPWTDHRFYRADSPSMTTLHDCRAAQCLSDMVLFHTESAIYHILTPSFLYPIEFHESYFLDVLLYLKPSGHVTVTPSVIDRFVNKEDVISEMEYLYPFAEWDMEISIERRDLRGISYEFKKQFERVKHVEQDFYGRSISHVELSIDNLKPYLVEWAQQRLQDRPQADSDDAWTIPILIAVDDTDTDVLLDDGTLGIAPGMPGNASAPCCVLAVADAGDVWEDMIGLDNLILHETGHVLGLHHPFLAFKYGEPTFNGYFNWYSSPMAYSLPALSTACGTFYNAIYDDPCGNAAASFTKFERQRVADVRLASLLKMIDERVDSLPAKHAESIEAGIDDIVRKFEAGDTLSEAGALPSAIALYESTETKVDEEPTTTTETKVDEEPTTTTETKVDEREADPQEYDIPKDAEPRGAHTIEDEAPPPDTTLDGIPDWIKSSAGWWAEGLVEDSEFLAGIEYLIDEGIITVYTGSSDTDVLQDSEDAVPDWIKSSAGWWSQGLLSDDEFAGSMAYLVSKGIIRIG